MQNSRHRFLTTVADHNPSMRRKFRMKAGKVNALTLFSLGISAVVMLTACSKAPSHHGVESTQNTPSAATQSPSQGPAQAKPSSADNTAGASSKEGADAPSAHQMASATNASSDSHASSVNAPISTCQPNELTVKRVSGDAGMGSVYEGIAFTNTGTHACTLSGTPGVQRITASGEKIRPIVAPRSVAPKSEANTAGQGGQASSITLQPQQSAYTTLGLNNLAPDGSPYVPKQCKAAKLSEVQFTWSGSHSVTHMKQPGYGCTTGIDKLQVQPFSNKKPDA